MGHCVQPRDGERERGGQGQDAEGKDSVMGKEEKTKEKEKRGEKRAKRATATKASKVQPAAQTQDPSETRVCGSEQRFASPNLRVRAQRGRAWTMSGTLLLLRGLVVLWVGLGFGDSQGFAWPTRPHAQVEDILECWLPCHTSSPVDLPARGPGWAQGSTSVPAFSFCT